MAAPVANFSYQQPVGLSVKFVDSSSGSPTSWAWTFKDNLGATVATSAVQSPTQVFPADGIYTAQLIATNVDGASEPYSFDLNLDPVGPNLTLTIGEMVKYDVKGSIDITNPGFKNLVQKWQLYIQPFIKPTGIPDADVFDESKWPPIANVLIAKLVVYDLLMIAVTAATAASGAATSDTEMIVPQGTIRKMETGPSKTEWYDGAVFLNSLFKSYDGGAGGIIAMFTRDICALAGRLDIPLPNICPKKKFPNIPLFINTAGGCGCGGPVNPNWWFWDNFTCQQYFYLNIWEA